MSDIKKLEQEIDAKIEAYVKISKSNAIDRMLDAKDYFIGQLSYVGQMEANLQERKGIDEAAYTTARSAAYMKAREEDKKSGTDSEHIGKINSSNELIDSLMSVAAYKRAFHLRERVHKVIDSISQRVSVLRKEKDAVAPRGE